MSIQPPRPGYTRDEVQFQPIEERVQWRVNWSLVLLIAGTLTMAPVQVILWRWAL